MGDRLEVGVCSRLWLHGAQVHIRFRRSFLQPSGSAPGCSRWPVNSADRPPLPDPLLPESPSLVSVESEASPICRVPCILSARLWNSLSLFRSSTTTRTSCLEHKCQTHPRASRGVDEYRTHTMLTPPCIESSNHVVSGGFQSLPSWTRCL